MTILNEVHSELKQADRKVNILGGKVTEALNLNLSCWRFAEILCSTWFPKCPFLGCYLDFLSYIPSVLLPFCFFLPFLFFQNVLLLIVSYTLNFLNFSFVLTTFFQSLFFFLFIIFDHFRHLNVHIFWKKHMKCNFTFNPLVLLPPLC